jgi:hypothetical protein
MPCLGRTRRALCTLFVLMSACASLASASATLLLEEPYGKFGFFTLRRGNPPKVSESDIEHDWKLLQRARNASEDAVAARSAKLTQPDSQPHWGRPGNQP